MTLAILSARLNSLKGLFHSSPLNQQASLSAPVATASSGIRSSVLPTLWGAPVVCLRLNASSGTGSRRFPKVGVKPMLAVKSMLRSLSPMKGNGQNET